MDVIAGTGFSCGAAAAGIDGGLGRVRGNETIAASADQITTARFQEGSSNGVIILAFEKLHQCPLHFSITKVPRDVNLLLGNGVESGVVHARGDVEGGGYEILHLLRFVAVFFKEDGKFDHRIHVGTGMGGNEVWNQVLLLAGLFRLPAELAVEILKCLG